MKNMRKKQCFYLITGLMASGKSSVSEALCHRYEKCVHLRGDIFRKMIVTGRIEMSSNNNSKALEQLYLRYDLTIEAAKKYFDAGFSLVMQDNYYGKELDYILDKLKDYPVRLVVLSPDIQTIKKRENNRDKTGYENFSVEALYSDFIKNTKKIGFWLDTSNLTIDETVNQIISHYDYELI